MGGAGSEVTTDTTDILLECALFNPSSVSFREVSTSSSLFMDSNKGVTRCSML